MDLFISYSRKDRVFVESLYHKLCQEGLDIWIDLEAIPPAEPFMREIYSGIVKCSNFVFVISPDSASSETCNLEVEHAVKNNKRTIPILYKLVSPRGLPESPVKSLLDRINWVRLKQVRDIEKVAVDILDVINTDYDFVRVHTSLLERAHEWVNNGRHESYLLRGNYLDSAEQWLENSKNLQPLPTELHRIYIQASRKTQLEEAQQWEQLYSQAEQEKNRAERTLAEFYQEQGRRELIDQYPQRALLYLRESYKLQSSNFAIRYLLGQAMQVIDTQISHYKEHSDYISCVIFSPNGQYLLSTGHDGRVIVWDCTRKEVVKRLEAHLQPITEIKISHNGQYFATASDDHTVKLWDATKFECLATLEAHIAPARQIVFSSDDCFLATAAARDSDADENVPDDITPCIWRIPDGELVCKLVGHSERITSLIFVPDELKILTASGDSPKVRIWDGSTGNHMAELNTESEDINDIRAKNGISNLTFSPDKDILLASSDGQIIAWNWQTRNELYIKTGHISLITSLKFSPNSDLFATTGLDQSVIVWQAKTGDMISRLVGHTGTLHGGIFGQDGQYVLSYGDRAARLWEAESGRLAMLFDGHYGDTSSACFNPDGTQIATAGDDKVVRIWDTTNCHFKAIPGCSGVFSLSVDFSGSRVLTTDLDQNAIIWDIHSASKVVTFGDIDDDLEYSCFSPKGNLAAVMGRNGFAAIYSSHGSKLLHRLTGHEETVKHADFSPNQKYIATASSDKTARLWNTSTGQPLFVLDEHQSEVLEVCFDSTGRTLVSTSEDGTAKIWRVSDGKCLFTLPHDGFVFSAKYILESSHIITCSEDGTAKLWDRNGQLVTTFRGHTGPVFTIDINQDGSQVLTGSADGTAKIWETPSGKLLRSLDDHRGLVWDAKFGVNGEIVGTLDWQDRSVKVWDTANGDLLMYLENPVGITVAFEFHPNGNSLITGQIDSGEYNPTIYTRQSTQATGGSMLTIWKLPKEIRDPNQIHHLVERKASICFELGRIIPKIQ